MPMLSMPSLGVCSRDSESRKFVPIHLEWTTRTKKLFKISADNN